MLVIELKAIKNNARLEKFTDLALSTNKTLFDSQFNFIPSMAELLPVLSSKYRLYLINKVPSAGCAKYLDAQMLLKSLNEISDHNRIHWILRLLACY